MNYKFFFKVVVPHETGFAVTRGAVEFGMNSNRIAERKCRLTYGIGVLNKFDPLIHPKEKKIIREGREWCTDIFDVFVRQGDPVQPGDRVVRAYCPATKNQQEIIIQIYSTTKLNPIFVTEHQVAKCGVLRLKLTPTLQKLSANERREIEATMEFGHTEISVSAFDKMTQSKVKSVVDFLKN